MGMEKLNHAHSKISSETIQNSQAEQTFSEQDLNKLASFFSLLIQIDKRNQRIALRHKELPNESNNRT